MPAATPAALDAPRSGPAPARPVRAVRTPTAEGTSGDPAKGEVRGAGVEVKTARHSTFEIHPSYFASLPGRLFRAKNWLLLIEAVTSAGPVDGKRRKELKELFAGCKAGLVFVTAFESRRTLQTFVSHIAWESEVWIAEDPDHMIHFNGERFLGPYPDVVPKE